MSALISPGALCRLDAAAVRRIGNGEGLPGVALSATLAIVLGAGAYGVAFGVWRAPSQALFSAVKLPVLLLGVAACTTLLSAMAALLLRSRLSLAQTAVAILVSLAVTATVLGAASPVSILFALALPPPDPDLVGLSIDDPRVQPALSVARELLLLHVAIIALAGAAGVLRLRGLLRSLGLEDGVARRVMVSWMAAQFLVGTQLSWLLRPFFGRPHLRPTFLVDDFFDGNFFDEVLIAFRSAFGPGATGALVVVGAASCAGLAYALRSSPTLVSIEVAELGFRIASARALRSLPWGAVAEVRASGARVTLVLAADETLAREVLTVACVDALSARALAAHIDVERGRVRAGPFRTAAS